MRSAEPVIILREDELYNIDLPILIPNTRVFF